MELPKREAECIKTNKKKASISTTQDGQRAYSIKAIPAKCAYVPPTKADNSLQEPAFQALASYQLLTFCSHLSAP